MERNQYTREEAVMRIRSQMSLEKKKRKGTIYVENC